MGIRMVKNFDLGQPLNVKGQAEASFRGAGGRPPKEKEKKKKGRKKKKEKKREKERRELWMTSNYYI